METYKNFLVSFLFNNNFGKKILFTNGSEVILNEFQVILLKD